MSSNVEGNENLGIGSSTHMSSEELAKAQDLVQIIEYLLSDAAEKLQAVPYHPLIGSQPPEI